MAPKAKKKKQVHLTPAEFAIMQILWRSERPLQGPEIMAIIDKQPEGPAFSRSSYHVLINDLLAKEYIVAVSGRGHGKHQARAFAPTVTHNEYHAIQITSSELYHPDDIADLVCSLLKYTKDPDTPAILAQINEAVQERITED